MSMTPEEASEFICPVLPRLTKRLEGFSECKTTAQQKCVAGACMWWIGNPSTTDGQCAVVATTEFLGFVDGAMRLIP